jgi:hypothetical protein
VAEADGDGVGGAVGSRPAKGHHVATKERLAAMAASLCAVCSGAMIVKLVAPDARDGALELRTYACAECGHSQTYSVESGDG